MNGDWRTDVSAENTEARAILQRLPEWKYGELYVSSKLCDLDANNFALCAENAKEELKAFGKWYRYSNADHAICADPKRDFTDEERAAAEKKVSALVRRVRREMSEQMDGKA